MGLLKTVFQRESIFPENITNEYINAMPRGALTGEQKARPYAKYYYRDMAPIPRADLDRANAGPVEVNRNLPFPGRRKS